MAGKRLSFPLFFIAIFAFIVNAQTDQLRGRVEDTAGKAVAGATVVLRNLKTGLERVVSTGSEGQFSFDRLGSGDFEVIGTAAGFARSSKPASGGEIVITLEPSIIREDVTVVSGSRQEELRESLNTKVDVLTANDIKSTGYETVGEALREVPGVITRRGSETTPTTGEQIQGIDSRQVLVLMDGQPVTGARGVKSGIINLDRQQIGQLESIEVVKGASSALYGSDAIGGVINLRTVEQTKPFSASASVAGGSYGAFDGRGTIGFIKKDLSGFFNYGRHKNNGFDLYPSDFSMDGSGYHRDDLYGKLKYQFANNFSVLISGNGYWNNYKGRATGEPTNFIDLGRQVIDVDDNSQNYGATADWAIDSRTNLQVRGYYSRYDEIYRAVGYITQTPELDGNLFERYGKFDFTFSRIIGERHFLQAGAEFAKNTYSGLFRLQNDRGEATTQVAWLQDKISLLDRLTLTVGGRFDHHSEFGNAVSPKVGLNYRVTDWASLRASWGRGFRAPDLGQLNYNFRNPLFRYQILGNKFLAPEHSGSWQIGGEFYALDRKARFGINLFRNDVRNLINSQRLGTALNQTQAEAFLTNVGADPSSAQYITTFPTIVYAYLNLANVYTQGVEVDGTYILPRGFAVSGAYTFLEAIDKATYAFLTGRHKHHGFTKLGYDNPKYGFNANFRGTFYGNWWVTSGATPTGRKAPAFQIFDLYGSKDIYKGFSLFASVDNIFNSQDPVTGLPDPSDPTVGATPDRADVGRTFRVGIRWNFDRGR